MIISDEIWTNYIKALRDINDEAARKMFAYLATHEWWTSGKAKQAAVDYAFSIATAYGEAATAVACEMYDAIVELTTDAWLAPAVPAQTATYAEVAKAVNGTMKTGNAEIISGAVSRLVKTAGVDTTMQNALRDGAEWAWIPRGDTCAFCLTLASRGWQRASKKAIRNGHAEHIHANCDCTYAVRFSSRDDVAGYDPDAYRAFYDSQPGKPQAKINAMRREIYAENKEKINAQKRSAYEKRKERNSSAAEEINIE